MKKNKKASDDNTPIRQDEIKTEPTTQEKKKKPIFKRVWFWIIIVIIVLIIVAAALSGDDESSTATESSVTVEETIGADTENTIIPTDYDNIEDFLIAYTEDVEENSSEMVLYISAAASVAENYYETNLVDEAVNYIAENYPDYYESNDIMELAMFYGYYLDYAYDDTDDYSNVGFYTYAAIKYTYRNTEDENQKYNLEELQEYLDKLGFDVGEVEEEATTGEKNALAKAEDYLDYTAFSKSGLKDQLEYEGYTESEISYAINHLDNVNWKEQALLKAEDYLDYSAFSKSGLKDQLEYEGFTEKQAAYGVNNCSADWKEQAVLKAKDYMDYSSFSRSGLIDQLEYEGFTSEEAEYAVEQVYD